MKLLSLIAATLISCNFVGAQMSESESDSKPKGPAETKNVDLPVNKTDILDCSLKIGATKMNAEVENSVSDARIDSEVETVPKKTLTEKEVVSFLNPEREKLFKPAKANGAPIKPRRRQNGTDKFHWKPALAESLYFLGIQNGLRLIQKKTRREIKGKFLRDWAASAKNLGGWKDGDSFLTNYIAHPMQGAVTGRIFINNSPKSRRQNFGKSKEYWKSRFKAMAWSAVWSTQFELGPVSEASIGNVGLYDRTGPNRMGWVDLVVTPTAGTGVLIGEDIIDKFILKKWLERKTRSRTRIKIYRTFITPFQSFTNVLRGKAPWRRDNR